MSTFDPNGSRVIHAPFRKALFPFALVLSIGALAGCGRASEGPTGDALGGDPAVETLDVTVENQNFNDATITALWEGGSRERLGSVTGLTTQTFTVEPRSSAVRFEIDFLAGGDFVGELIAANPGDHIELTLSP
jgi:hypothetical protein